MRWPAVRIAHRGKRGKSCRRKFTFSARLFPRFLLPRNLLGDIFQPRGNCLVLHPSPIARWGPGGTKPKRRLWRMKRSVVLNRNEHSSGSEKATIEVAESLLPGAGGPQRPENLPVADFQRGRGQAPELGADGRPPSSPLYSRYSNIHPSVEMHATIEVADIQYPGKRPPSPPASLCVKEICAYSPPMCLPRQTCRCFYRPFMVCLIDSFYK